MTDSPRHLADRPATPADLLRSPQEFADPPALEEAALGLDAGSQPHDLLSELLRSVRLSGERIVAYAPLRTFSIGFADVGSLHILEEGELALRIDGDPHVEHVSCGDVVLLPRGDPHHISDAGKRAHAIKGASANIHAHTLSAAASNLENAARANAVQEIDGLVSQLKEKLRAVNAQLSKVS